MAGYPWDVLGIAPTQEAAAIQRAYARALRGCRPDEDPEGFQRLVDARREALAWRAPEPAKEPATGEPDVVTRLNEPELEKFFDSLEGSEWVADGPPTFGQPPPVVRLNVHGASFEPPGAGLPPALPPDGTYGLAPILDEMAGLLRNEDPWDGPAWRRLLGDAASLGLAEHARFREAVAREALHRLPALPDYEQARAEYFAGRGPAAAVEELEGAFAFGQDQARLAAATGQGAVLRYLGWLGYARRELPPSRRTPAQAETLALVAKLTGLRASVRDPPLDTWQTDDCRRLLALLARLPPGEREPVVAALLHGLSEGLPDTFDESMAKYLSGRSTAATVGLIEDALHLESASWEAVPPGSVLPPQYPIWAQAAARLRAIKDRREAGAYRDGNGIPLLPPEDAWFTIWGHERFAAYWAAAQRLGRWPRSFDWRAALFPCTELALSGIVGRRLGIALLVVFGWLLPVGAAEGTSRGLARHWPEALCLALLLLARAPLAMLIRRWAVLAASRRIRKADRAGLVVPGARALAIHAPVLRFVLLRRGLEVMFLLAVLQSGVRAFTAPDRMGQAIRAGHALAAVGTCPHSLVECHGTVAELARLPPAPP